VSRILGYHHASLVVADTERSKRFYSDILGLDIEPERPDLSFPGCWFRVGDLQLHLLEVPNPDPILDRPEHGGRDRHTAVGVDALDGFVERLEQAGIPFTLSRSGRRALFCRDPDGNAWELIEQLVD
jgi:glyoxylase I family protein